MKKFNSSRCCKIILFVVTLLGFQCTVNAEGVADDYTPTPACPQFQEVGREEVVSALQRVKNAPRLLLTDDEIEKVRTKVDADPRWRLYYEALKKDADSKIESSPVEYKLEGRRLLGVSREALKRIFTWSFLYRYTSEEKYARRVEEELLAIANFQDWHPAHFLDVAEMTTAVAIGYDSCKGMFSPENRSVVREALRIKGVLQSRNFKNGWKRNEANWNQVCWCGALFGALAIYGEEETTERDKTIDVIHDSINGITWSMKSYEPDGNYTEGPGYWGYGTGFNILFCAALNSSLGTDFGRSDSNGLLKSIDYYEHVFGTTGNAFNYPDSGGGKIFEPSAFWYVEKLGDPLIAWNENEAITLAYNKAVGNLKDPSVRSMNSLVNHRLSVCALLWGPVDKVFNEKSSGEIFGNGVNSATEGKERELGFVGIGNGLCCVALFRTEWNKDAGYLGIKCGRPNAPHGHLDEGSFVYDDKGLRWFVELGPEDYNKIESMGMNLWDTSQNSDRWKLLRYNNYGHNVLTINNELQIANQRTSFIETKIGKRQEESYAVIDLTPVYKNGLAKATRRATLLPNGDLVIEDSLEALPDKDAEVERRFLTPAQVTINDDAVELKQVLPSGSQSEVVKYFKTQSDVQNNIRVVPCETDTKYDAKNPGVSILIESSHLAAGQKVVLRTVISFEKPSE